MEQVYFTMLINQRAFAQGDLPRTGFVSGDLFQWGFILMGYYFSGVLFQCSLSRCGSVSIRFCFSGCYLNGCLFQWCLSQQGLELQVRPLMVGYACANVLLNTVSCWTIKVYFLVYFKVSDVQVLHRENVNNMISRQ